MFLKIGVEKWRGVEYYVECLKGQGEVLCMTRETRERWLLPTVETEVNGDTKSTNKRGSSLVGSLGVAVTVQEIFVLP
jgi:hypothetical protein